MVRKENPSRVKTRRWAWGMALSTGRAGDFQAVFSLLWVSAFYFVVSLLFTYPLVAAMGRALSDPVDPALNTWILAWGQQIVLARPLDLLNTNIFYPYQQTLLFSESLLLPSAALLPIAVATGNPILTHNLFVLLGFTATGTSGYLLGRWLFHNAWSGLALGGVLAFNSYTLTNIAQAQLLQLAGLPLALLYLGRLLRRPTLRSSLLLAAYMAAQFYAVIYYGLFGFLVVGLTAVIGWLLTSFASPALRRRALGLIGGSFALALLLCLPLGLPYLAVSRAHDFVRTWADAWPFSASLEMWRTAPPLNLLYGGRIGGDLPTLGFYALDALFPGVLLLMVALCGLLLWLGDATGLVGSGRSQAAGRAALRWPLALLVGIGFFFLLSLGPYLQIESLQPDFERVLPYAWIHQWFPGFSALRAPGRFAALVFLGLGIAGGYLFSRVRARALCAGLLALLLVEGLPAPAQGGYVPPAEPAQQAVYAWLAEQPATVYLELPVYRFGEAGKAELWLESQFMSTRHWQRTPVGYSGFFPPQYEEMLRFVARFPQAQATHFLQALGVEWVVIHRERLAAEQWQAVEAAVVAHGWETRQWDGILAVRLPALDVAPPEVRYVIPDRAQAGGRLTVDAVFTSEQPTPILPNSDLGAVRAEWWQGDRRVLVSQESYQPPFYVEPVAVAAVPVAVPDVEGAYTLQLYASQRGQLVASADVSVVADVAPPEITLLPLVGEAAVLECEAGEAWVRVELRTIGWYETSFTLSARVYDENNSEVARSAVDVEFPAEPPRSDLLSTHTYILPLAATPSPQAGEFTVAVVAYRWQQAAERIVARHFVTADGLAVDTLQLPLAISPSCE